MSQQQSGQLSEEQVRAYLAELRDAQVTDILAQVISTLLNGAQVKLGRRDARVLIDTAAAVIERIGPDLDEGFAEEVSSILSQLRMAQVQAEQEAGTAPAEGDEEYAAPEAGAAGGEQAPRGGDQTPASGAARPGGQAAADRQAGQGGSRLWVPPGARGG